MDEDAIIYSDGEKPVSAVRVGCLTTVILTGAYLILFKIVAQSALMSHVDL
jgi:hypothetical protein